MNITNIYCGNTLRKLFLFVHLFFRSQFQHVRYVYFNKHYKQFIFYQFHANEIYCRHYFNFMIWPYSKRTTAQEYDERKRDIDAGSIGIV